MLYLYLLLIIIGLALLIKGADILVEGASNLAKKYKVSELVIAMTIVAFGTSAPEFIISFTAALTGHPDISLGNIIGSNIFNMFVVLGITGLVYPISVQDKTIKYEIPFSLVAGLALFICAKVTIMQNAVSYVDRVDGVIFLMLFTLFLIYVYVNMKRDQEKEVENNEPTFSLLKSFLFMVLGLALLIFGGKVVVDFAVLFAGSLGVNEEVIALTIVAGGTSLPELMISVMAILKKKSDIAIGNIVGSNIFNILFILGVSAIATPISYQHKFDIDMYFLLGGSILLFVYTKMNKKLDRLEGSVFIGMYLWYIVYIIGRG